VRVQTLSMLFCEEVDIEEDREFERWKLRRWVGRRRRVGRLALLVEE
jgi:hypothetical protein